jgi:TorA maturation chaperone TorD
MNAAEYLLISRLFAYPDTPPAPEDLSRLSETCGEEGGSRDLSALQAEYVRLFINALPEVPCPPYGSFYLEGTLMGESTVRLQKLYASYGWHTEELSDHFAVELEFLGLMAAMGAEGPVLEDFLQVWEHLNRWAPQFLARVAEHDRSGFYRQAARYAQKVLGFQTTGGFSVPS